MKICVLLTYANPHVIGWLDEFIRISEHKVTVGVINSVKKYRRNFFAEVDEKNGYLYFFKGYKYEKLFYTHVRQCDCFITLGIFEVLFAKSVIFMTKTKMVFVLSEPFNPFNSRKLILRNLYAEMIKLFKKSSKFYFLCLGGEQVRKDYISFGFKRANFFQFGHFPQLKLSKKETFSKGAAIRFIYVGQLIPRKGVDILIAAIKYLQGKYINWEMDIIGDGILKDELLDHCQNEKRIQYIENIQEAEVIKAHFNWSHVLFLPSYFDGWGAVVNEALSSCCSLLLSENVYAGKSLLKDFENGFRFDPYNIGELYSAIDKYFDDPQLLNSHFKKSGEIFAEWNHKNAALSFNNFLNKTDNTQNETLFKGI